MISCIKKNWFFLFVLLGYILTFITRYSSLTTCVVSNPDTEIIWDLQKGALEQTWQPNIKMIEGISMPYQADADFKGGLCLRIYSDDYRQILVESQIDSYSFEKGTTGNVQFLFDKVKLIPGERYHIQISAQDIEEGSLLRIASGSNYKGCTIGGIQTEQGAALTIVFCKYSRLFWIASIVFPLFATSLVFMVLADRKWEDTVGMVILLEGLLLYVFGLFGQLELGIKAIFVFSLLLFLIAVYVFNKKDKRLKDLMSPGLFIFCVFFIIIILINHNEWLGNRDELRHWGLAVKDMFYYNSFAKHIDTTVLLPRYMPLATLIEYLFVYVNGLYSEDILLIAYQMMLLSMLVILSKPLCKGRKVAFLLPVLVTMVCIPTIFYHYISSTIMVDALLACVLAYILISYYTDKLNWFNVIRITVSLLALTLIKDIGLVLAGLTLFIIFGDVVISQVMTKKLKLFELLWPVACVGMVLLTFISWQKYMSIPITNQNNKILTYETSTEPENESKETETQSPGEKSISFATGVSESGITLKRLKALFSGDGEEYQYEATDYFVTALFDERVYSIGILDVSFADLLLILSAFVCLLGYLGFWQEETRRFYGFAGLIVIAGVMVCAFLQVTYWFTFPKVEAVEAIHYDRYLGSYICAIFVVIMYLLYERLIQKEMCSKAASIMVFGISFYILISMPVEGLIVKSNEMKKNTTEDMIYGYSDINEILRSTAKRGDKIYYVCNNSDGYSEYIFRNAVCPMVSEHANWNVVGSNEMADFQRSIYEKQEREYAESTKIISVTEWKDYLRAFEFVVLFHVDEAFSQSYAEVFQDATTIGNGAIYQVINQEGDISLKCIGKTGVKEYR